MLESAILYRGALGQDVFDVDGGWSAGGVVSRRHREAQAGRACRHGGKTRTSKVDSHHQEAMRIVFNKLTLFSMIITHIVAKQDYSMTSPLTESNLQYYGVL